MGGKAAQLLPSEARGQVKGDKDLKGGKNKIGLDGREGNEQREHE